jgi:hypothetical protein
VDRKPRLFIGSSTEGLDVAYAMQENLADAAQVTVWNQGQFELSSTVIEGLDQATRSFDCAAFVFAPSDVATIRAERYEIVRDNVLFELGLFIGSLGRNRCFLVQPAEARDLRLPTDLLGIVVGTYEPSRDDENLAAALGPACNRIRAQLAKYARIIDFEWLPSAVEALGRARDPYFRRMAETIIDEQAKLVTHGRIEYTISRQPDFLRSSLAIDEGTIRASFYIDAAVHARFLLQRKMESYLEYNALIAAKPEVMFKRLFVLREPSPRVRRYWETLTEVFSRQVQAGIEVRVLPAGALYDPRKPSEDTVVINLERVHIHAPKLVSDTPYSTAILSVDEDEVARVAKEWDRMWADALKWPHEADEIIS